VEFEYASNTSLHPGIVIEELDEIEHYIGGILPQKPFEFPGVFLYIHRPGIKTFFPESMHESRILFLLA
jgi:hypothetical protein